MDVSEAIATRVSCRAFRPDPVPLDTVRMLLDKAKQTPSGGNLQPWHVDVLTGAPLKALIADIASQSHLLPHGEGTEYNIYPPNLSEPYKARRYKCGADLYAVLGIAREDRAGRLGQFARNFDFFGAPVGLLFSIGREMEVGQWSDLGMYIHAVMLLAREAGLHTCAQEAWAMWPKTVARHIDIPPERMLFCGMALGVMDEDAPVNALRTDREPVDGFTTFRGWA
ncbi:MAG: nitroreductase [Rhodobiaceae bacterium]|nr:nitroreductase [Rhodobiaceae bacterium]